MKLGREDGVQPHNTRVRYWYASRAYNGTGNNSRFQLLTVTVYIYIYIYTHTHTNYGISENKNVSAELVNFESKPREFLED